MEPDPHVPSGHATGGPTSGNLGNVAPTDPGGQPGPNGTGSGTSSCAQLARTSAIASPHSGTKPWNVETPGRLRATGPRPYTLLIEARLIDASPVEAPAEGWLPDPL